jgi:hypothetical protein
MGCERATVCRQILIFSFMHFSDLKIRDFSLLLIFKKNGKPNGLTGDESEPVGPVDQDPYPKQRTQHTTMLESGIWSLFISEVV